MLDDDREERQQMEFDCDECGLDILDIFFKWSGLTIIISCYCPKCGKVKNFSVGVSRLLGIKKKSGANGGEVN